MSNAVKAQSHNASWRAGYKAAIANQAEHEQAAVAAALKRVAEELNKRGHDRAMLIVEEFITPGPECRNWLVIDDLVSEQQVLVSERQVLDVATIRKCHEQLKAVAITDPKELIEFLRGPEPKLTPELVAEIQKMICDTKF